LAAGYSYGNVEKAAMPEACRIIGIWNGEPPAYIFEDCYRDFVSHLKDVKSRSNASVELMILNLRMRSMK
jgi:hypothetical protein